MLSVVQDELAVKGAEDAGEGLVDVAGIAPCVDQVAGGEDVGSGAGEVLGLGADGQPRG